MDEYTSYEQAFQNGYEKGKTDAMVDAIPVTEIKTYLQRCLDKWEALGDRKWEPANMWGYNFIMACFDDLERRDSHA